MFCRLFVFCTLIAHAPTAAIAQSSDTKSYLLNVSKDQMPTDTGSTATKLSVVTLDPGGRAVKAVLVNSVGDFKTRVKDWTPHRSLNLRIVNLEKDTVKLDFVVRHKNTKDYATRVDVPLTLKPDLNEIRLDIAGLLNNNSSTPDLANVTGWYLATDKKTVTIVLGDFWFAGEPIPVSKTGSDPARLERLKNAKMPKIDKVIEFNTPEADAICSALEVFPANNPWNQVIENWPVHPNSKGIVDKIGASKPFRYNPDMSFILIPPDYKKVNVKIVSYADESDKGPYPVPDNTPIEGWPSEFLRNAKLKSLTLDDVQRDKIKQNGDRHAIIVDPTNRMLYEFYQMKKTDAGWQAAQASIFDLKSNKLRPDGWTSTDAAGLPIFPAVIRYDELKRGMVEHAVRVTFAKTRRAYVYPATHYASKLTDENLPRMGERFRLRADFEIKGFTPETTAILKGLQKYGMICADNGLDWALSCAPDPRIPVLHLELRKLKGSDFEVVPPPGGYGRAMCFSPPPPPGEGGGGGEGRRHWQ